MTATATAAQPFGVLSAHRKDQLYLVCRGYIFTSPWVVSEATRFAASVLLTARRAPFELCIAERTERHQAAAIEPMITRHLRAEDVQLISVGISPNHRHYRRFRAINCSGCLPLPRDAYAEFDLALEAAYNGKLTIEEAKQLFEDITNVTVGYLPPPKHADPRIELALEMLRDDANYPLTQLSAAVGLSYDRMSHLFAETVGLPLRSYLLWQKLHTVSALLNSGLTLTEIAVAAGFTDSAHLSNAWQKAYGISPSYFVRGGSVEIRQLPERPRLQYQ